MSLAHDESSLPFSGDDSHLQGSLPPLPQIDSPQIDLSLEHCGLSSIGGGVSPLFAREKIAGPYEPGGVTLHKMLASFLLYNEQAPSTDGIDAEGRFRTCARVHLPEALAPQLADDVTQFKTAHPDIPLEIEYCYRCGGDSADHLVVGLGINAPLRYDGERYEGARWAQSLNPQMRRPFTRADVEELQHQYSHRLVSIDGRYDVVSAFRDLDPAQLTSLSRLLQATFGPHWTPSALTALDLIPHDIHPIILIDRASDEIAAFALGERDHETQTVEVTEWAASPRYPGAGTQAMKLLVDALSQSSSDYRIYGEFNSGAALRSALKVGFRLPEQHPVLEAEAILFAHVWVERLADFVVLEWPEKPLTCHQ